MIHHLGGGLFWDLIDVATSVSPRAASVQGGLVHSGCDPRPRVKGASTLWQRKGRQAAPRLSLPSLWQKQPEGRRAAPRLWRCGRRDSASDGTLYAKFINISKHNVDSYKGLLGLPYGCELMKEMTLSNLPETPPTENVVEATSVSPRVASVQSEAWF